MSLKSNSDECLAFEFLGELENAISCLKGGDVDLSIKLFERIEENMRYLKSALSPEAIEDPNSELLVRG